MALIPVPDKDERPISLGKYKGMTPNEISEVDPKYLMWMYENVDGSCSKDLYILCEELVEDIQGGDREW